MKWLDDPGELRKVRLNLGLKQHELAERAGVNRARVAGIEARRRPLTREVAHRLWFALANYELELKTMQLVPLSSLMGLPSKEAVEAELVAIEAATNAVTA